MINISISGNFINLIHFVAEKLNITKHFTHILPKYSKTELEPNALFATLTAKATGISTKRMSEISDITHSDLDNIESNFMQIENLKKSVSQLMELIFYQRKRLIIA